LNQNEDENEDYYPKSRSFRERSQSQTQTHTLQKPLPAIPPRPQSQRLQSNNPFNSSTYDDFAPSGNYLQPSQFSSDNGGKNTFGVDGNHGKGKKAIGGTGDWIGWDEEGMNTTSPTSSSRTGTTNASSNDEDPFR
jgi:hypothetical protein